MVEHQQRSGKDETGFRPGGREACRESGGKQPGHTVAEIAVQRAGQRRQVEAVGRAQFNAAHDGTQAVRKVRAFQRSQGREPFVGNIQSENSRAAARNEAEVAGQDAVAAPTAVYLGAFEQNAVRVAAKRAEKTDGGVHVRREPCRVLRERNGRGMDLCCHDVKPAVEREQKKAAIPGRMAAVKPCCGSTARSRAHVRK